MNPVRYCADCGYWEAVPGTDLCDTCVPVTKEPQFDCCCTPPHPADDEDLCTCPCHEENTP